MAAVGFVARGARRLTEEALRLRRPTRRLAGSVRAAVALGAIAVGSYTLVVASLYWAYPYYFRDVVGLVYTTSGFSFITAAMNVALLFGIILRKDELLHRILSVTMAVYKICVFLSLSTISAVAINGHPGVVLWETFRFGVCLLHLGLMYCLLAELRGDSSPEDSAPPPAAGWLKNNLSRQDAARVAGDQQQLAKAGPLGAPAAPTAPAASPTPASHATAAAATAAATATADAPHSPLLPGKG